MISFDFKQLIRVGRRLLIALLLVFGLILLVQWGRMCHRTATERDLHQIVDHAMAIRAIEEVVKLSTAEVYQEVPIVDTVAGYVVALIVQARTYIDFDLEQIPRESVGDTLYVQLPPEIVTSYETGYRIVDVHPLSPAKLFNRSITAQQEQLIKAKIPDKLANLVYKAGHVRAARKQARDELTRLLATMYPGVIIIDSYPDGIRHKQWSNTLHLPILD